MASYSTIRNKTATLSTTTQDTVTLTTAWDFIEVQNISGTSAVAFKFNTGVPAVDGDDSHHVEPGEALKVPVNNWTTTATGPNTVVNVIGNGNKYRVNGVRKSHVG